MSSRPFHLTTFSVFPIANLYERQTRCVFTNLGYIQDFLFGGNILVIFKHFDMWGVGVGGGGVRHA